MYVQGWSKEETNQEDVKMSGKSRSGTSGTCPSTAVETVIADCSHHAFYTLSRVSGLVFVASPEHQKGCMLQYTSVERQPQPVWTYGLQILDRVLPKYM